MDWSTMERLRIYTGESERIEGVPAYEHIVRAAHARGMAGATVLRGMMGFSGHSEIHTAKILRLAEDLPILIEIIDSSEKIEAFCQVEVLKIKQCLLSRDSVRVKVFRA
jgi:hypothetical protein